MLDEIEAHLGNLAINADRAIHHAPFDFAFILNTKERLSKGGLLFDKLHLTQNFLKSRYVAQGFKFGSGIEPCRPGMTLCH